jgi:hypothetical protein
VGSQHGVFRINGRHSAIVFVSLPLHTKNTLQIPKPSNRYTLASLGYGTPYGEVDHGARLRDPINAMQLDVNLGVTSAGVNSNYPTAQFVARRTVEVRFLMMICD